MSSERETADTIASMIEHAAEKRFQRLQVQLDLAQKRADKATQAARHFASQVASWREAYTHSECGFAEAQQKANKFQQDALYFRQKWFEAEDRALQAERRIRDLEATQEFTD
jgi:hypothetical protein